MLLLFDIDGTLVGRMPPVHRQAICAGMRAVYGVHTIPEGLGQTAGMTDTAIVTRALLLDGVSPETIRAGLSEFYAVAAREYERIVPTDLSAHVLPHVAEVLDALRTRQTPMGLVTGNVERIAWAKLGAASIARDFRCGAFGDEAEDRNALPPIAAQRASEVFGRAFAPEEVYIIGDTPHDIACGAASGYRTVGVATGPAHDLDALRACGPDYVIEDMRGLHEVLGL